MSQITINIPDELILKLQEYEDVEDIIIQALENYIETKTPPIPKTKTWELCGTLEVTNPNPEYIVSSNEKGEVITNYAESLDKDLY